MAIAYLFRQKKSAKAFFSKKCLRVRQKCLRIRHFFAFSSAPIYLRRK
nr:MAG TPA: hypothetical protein [Caudoviricetes sp.]